MRAQAKHRTTHSVLVRLHWLLSTQFGFDPLKTIRSLRGLPRYLRDLSRFRKASRGRLELVPCLHDWSEEGGTTKSEYFWQDLLVARRVFEAKPEKHLDIGSRVDGFVAHVASFREIEVFDIRPITTQIPGVVFRQADLMSRTVTAAEEEFDSLSCLHALEHFGLGRYGDPIDPNGFRQGIANMARLLKPNGTFYLSVPIGVERVEFNANRVFDPRTIVEVAGAQSLRVTRLTVLSEDGVVQSALSDASQLAELASRRYSLGLFEFRKHAH
jgi:SAM-dependent methyltransferase